MVPETDLGLAVVEACLACCRSEVVADLASAETVAVGSPAGRVEVDIAGEEDLVPVAYVVGSHDLEEAR